MTDREWQSKDGTVVRKSPRRVLKKCNRPFTAPRRVVQETVDSEVQIITESEANPNVISNAKTQDVLGSEVQFVTETENAREIDIRERQLDLDTQESTADISKTPSQAELESDTTESTPDILKSPQSDIVMPGVLSHIVIPDVLPSPAKTKTSVRPRRGIKKVTVLETQLEESEADSDDHIPLVQLLKPKTSSTPNLTAELIAACQDGPLGPRSIGVNVAKTFGDEKFQGTIDSYRVERGRCIYHVTYTDGDEEELSQTELRDCYLLALAPQS